MDQLLEFFHRLRDVKALIAWSGYAGLTVIIFAETGLLIGFFLPGDSLLVTAGILSSQGNFNVVLLGILLSSASILGNAAGYYIGRAGGTRLFRREESRFFKPRYLRQAHPEPNRPTPAAANCSLNFSKSPNDDLIASASLPLGVPPALGPMSSQNRE